MKKSMRDALWVVGGSAAAVLLLGACLQLPELPGPVVYIRVGEAFNLSPSSEPTRWTDGDLKWIASGARQWKNIGFDVREPGEPIDTTLPPEDVIVIDLYRDTGLQAENKFGGLSDRVKRVSFINAGLTDFRLMGTVTHELGHQLLNTSEHLPREAYGVMTPGSNSWSLQAADYELACRVAQRCERY